MANKATIKVNTYWSDKAGNIAKVTFNVELPETITLTAIEAKVQAMVAAIDAVSDCKFVSANMAVPAALTLTTPKENAVAGSSARRHASAFFLGEAGENGRSETVETLYPDPIDAEVDFTQKRPGLKPAGTATAAFITAMTTVGKTAGGEAVAEFKGSFIRQRAMTVRSKQAA